VELRSSPIARAPYAAVAISARTGGSVSGRVSDHLVVSEAFGGAAGASAASSYRCSERAPATPVLVSGSVPTQQPAAGITATGAGVLDPAVSAGGRQLYALASKGGLIASYTVRYDGSLQRDGQASGVPKSAAGLGAN
jgi:hypothetical protein